MTSTARPATDHGKRLDMHLCPACSGGVIQPDTHGPEDDLADIRKRDAAYNGEVGVSLADRALNNGDLNGRMQMAADRRMLLRMLDAELSEPR